MCLVALVKNEGMVGSASVGYRSRFRVGGGARGAGVGPGAAGSGTTPDPAGTPLPPASPLAFPSPAAAALPPHAAVRPPWRPPPPSAAPAPPPPEPPSPRARAASPALPRFALPGSSGGVTDAWEGILKYQLDINHKPCNFVELFPRLKEK